jgi:hypothetical protein
MDGTVLDELSAAVEGLDLPVDGDVLASKVRRPVPGGPRPWVYAVVPDRPHQGSPGTGPRWVDGHSSR